MMKGVIVKTTDDLELTNIPEPEAKQDELLIKVSHAAVNRTDIVTRNGQASYAANPVLGVEVAGTVVETNGNQPFSEGDRVKGLVNSGGYAEYAVMMASSDMLIQESFSLSVLTDILDVILT